MHFKSIALLLLLPECLAVANITENISLAVSLIKKQIFAGKLNAYLCWSQEEKLELWRVCSENFISARIKDTTSMLHNYYPKNRQFFLVDLDCKGTHDLLRQAGVHELFKWPNRWIILGGNSTNTDLQDYFFEMESNMFVARRDTEEKGYVIKMPYKIATYDKTFRENSIATWKNENWLSYNHISVPRNRTDLMGTRFQAAFVFDKPDSINHIYDYRDTHIDTMGKAHYILITTIMEAVNVTPVRKYYKSRGYQINGSDQYDEMLGSLQRNESDITGVSILMTLERRKILHFMYPTFYDHLRFVFRAPPLSHVTNIFTVPFDIYVWYASFAVTFLILPCLYVIVRWEWRILLPTDNAQVLRDDVFDVFVTELGAITQQGTETEPRSVSGRIAMYVTFLAYFFLYNAFCANIVAILQATSERITKPSDLYDSGILLGAEDVSYSRVLFKDSGFRETDQIQKLVSKKVTFANMFQGVQRVKNEFYAFHCEISVLYKMAGDIFSPEDICKLRELIFFDILENQIALPRNSTYKKIMKYRLLQMHEFGVISCLQKRTHYTRPKCLSQGSVAIVGIMECYAAYLIFGIGIGCSFILFIMEIVWRRIKLRVLSRRKLRENPGELFFRRY